MKKEIVVMKEACNHKIEITFNIDAEEEGKISQDLVELLVEEIAEDNIPNGILKGDFFVGALKEENAIVKWEATPLYNLGEIIFDLAQYAYIHFKSMNINSRQVMLETLYLAHDFLILHEDTDWCKVDYVDTIFNFAEIKFKELEQELVR